jgi:hypothetical protein
MRSSMNGSGAHIKGYSSSGAPGMTRRGSQSSDAGDAGSYTSVGSMNDNIGSGPSRSRHASPMLVGSRAAPTGSGVGGVGGSGPGARASTPTRSWRF